MSTTNTDLGPGAPCGATLVDLLDRVLDRGLVVQADIIISVAGIPLIGVSLRAALAGVETMLQYGMMREWDQKVRSQANLVGPIAAPRVGDECPG